MALTALNGRTEAYLTKCTRRGGGLPEIWGFYKEVISTVDDQVPFILVTLPKGVKLELKRLGIFQNSGASMRVYSTLLPSSKIDSYWETAEAGLFSSNSDVWVDEKGFFLDASNIATGSWDFQDIKEGVNVDSHV